MDEVRYSPNWIVYTADGKPLTPRTYEDAKPQDVLVDEVVTSLKGPYRYIILRASTGAGKSVMIMSSVGAYIARPSSSKSQRHRGVVLTPTNALALQYYEDFMLRKYRLIKDGIALSVAVLFGKDRYRCALDSRYTALTAKCNMGSYAKRLSCSMYKPVVTHDVYTALSSAFKVNAVPYECVSGTCYYIMRSGTGCRYYDDLAHYIAASIIVTNPWKYMTEFERGTLPSNSVVAIDEFDGVLLSMVPMLQLDPQYVQALISKFNMHSNKTAVKLLEAVRNVNVEPYDVFHLFVDFINAVRNVVYAEFKQCVETSDNLSDCLRYVELMQEVNSYERKLKISFTSIRAFRYKNKVVIVGDLKSFSRTMGPKVLLVSATLLPDSILERMGIDDYVVIEGPKRIRGTVYAVVPSTVVYASKTAITSDPEYAAAYANAFRDAVKLAMHYKPTFISVPAYWIYEHPMVRAALSEVLDLDDVLDKDGSKILELRDGKRDVVISAFATRGIDLSNDRCRSVVVPKLPVPDLDNAEILASVFGESKSVLNLLTTVNLYHTISRAVRGDGDWAVLISPDIRTYMYLKRLERSGYTRVEWFKAPIPADGVESLPNVESVENGVVKFKVSDELVQLIEQGNVDVLRDEYGIQSGKLGDVRVLDEQSQQNKQDL